MGLHGLGLVLQLYGRAAMEQAQQRAALAGDGLLSTTAVALTDQQQQRGMAGGGIGVKRRRVTLAGEEAAAAKATFEAYVVLAGALQLGGAGDGIVNPRITVG